MIPSLLGDAVVCGIELIAADIELEGVGVLRDIYPHADSRRLERRESYGGEIESYSLVAGRCRLGEIRNEGCGVAAVSDLTRGSVGKPYLSLFPLTPQRSTLALVSAFAAPAGYAAVFEVKYRLGRLAELDIGNSCAALVPDALRRNRTARNAGTLGAGRVGLSVYRAHARVAKLKANVAVLHRNGIEAVVCRSDDRQVEGLAIGNCHIGRGEGNIGNHDVNYRFADDPAVVHHLKLGISRLAARGEHAVFNSTHCRVLDSERRALGDLRRGACGTDADCAELNCGLRSYPVVLCRKDRAVENIGGESCGGDDDTCGNCTLGAVGGTVDDLNRVLARGLGGIGRRAAAVEVDSVNAAHLEQYLSELVSGRAAGEGLLTSVGNHEYSLTVGCNAGAGARLTCYHIGISVAGGNVLAVADKPAVTGSSLPDRAFSVAVDVLAEVPCVVDDSGLAVVQDGKEVVIAVCAEGDAVDKGNTHRLTRRHVVEGGVNTCYNIVVFADKVCIVGVCILFVGVGCLLGQLCHTQNAVLILIEVGGLNYNVVAGYVRCSDVVDHLLAVGGISILNILRNAGGKSRLGILVHRMSRCRGRRGFRCGKRGRREES